MADLPGYTALSDSSAFTFESKGKHSFKNISEEKEVFELITDHLKVLLSFPLGSCPETTAITGNDEGRPRDDKNGK